VNRELRDIAAERVLGLLGPEGLREAGDAALTRGIECPALIALVTHERGDADALFEQVLVELGIPKPSVRSAILDLARDAASEIVSGRTAPFAGAKRIWDLTLRAPKVEIPELDPFIYAASEWEDRPADRMLFERGIMAEARALLNQSSLPNAG
jgi:hypothetical protein